MTVVEASPASARLRLRPASRAPAAVDGVWLPRSRDLARELLPLLAELRRAGHVVRRVSYDLSAWQPIGRRLSAEDQVVRLSGFHLPRPETLRLVATSGAPALVLAVVDPALPADEAAALFAGTSYDPTVAVPAPRPSTPSPIAGDQCMSGA
jgi:hypothetical protein